MADINKTVKSVHRQESSSNKLFDAANALIRNVNNAGTNTAALDKYQSQIGELNTKIQQQIAVLNTLRADLSSGGIDPTNMSHRMAKESVDAFLDLMQDRSRELGKLPATIAQARGAARQETTTTPPATTARAKRGEKVNTGPPVTTSFDPEIAAAATAGIAEISIPEPAAPPASIPSASPIARATRTRTSTPKPAAPPPAPSPPPTTLGPKFSVISREEAMAGSASAPKPPKPPKPPKAAKPAAKPAAPPPTVPPIDGGTTTGGDDEEDDDTLNEAFGPYGPGFSRKREASRLRALGETLGPQVAAITAAGGFRDPTHEQEITGAVGGYARSSGLFKTSFGVARYHTRASQLQKELAGVPTTLGDPTARNRFQGIEDQYRSMLSRPLHPDDVFAFGEQIRQEKAGLAQDASLNPQQRGQLMQQLNNYETGVRNLGNVTPIAPGSQGSALSRQTLAGASVAQGIYSRNTEMERGGITDSRREELRDQIAAGREMLQVAERRLRLAHEQAELEGRVTREMQHQYESAQREVGALGGRLNQQEKDLGAIKTTSTTRGQIEDMFEGRAPSLGQAILNYRGSTGRQTGTMASSMLRAMDHPLGFGMGMMQAGGTAAGRGVAGAMGATSSEALSLGGAAGSFAAIPVAGAIAGVLALIMGQLGNAANHGQAVEQLYRRGGQAGTGFANVGSAFENEYYKNILSSGQGLGYSRDQSVALAQQLATAGMSSSNVLNQSRMRSAMQFSRTMGVDLGATGQSLAEMQRLGIGRGEGGQERLLGLIAQSVSQGGMQGRENEVLQSITRLTTTLAERGVAQDMRGGFGQTTAMLDLFNRSGNPALMGQYGANVLSRMDQGIQGATGYKDAFLFNEYNRQAGGGLDPFTYQYRKAAGVNDPGAFQAMTDLVKFSGGSQRGGVALNEQFGLGSPLIGLQLAQMIESGQVSKDTLADTVQRLKTGGVTGAAAGAMTGPEGLGTYENFQDALNGVTNKLEEFASDLANPIATINTALTALAGVVQMVTGGTGGTERTPGSSLGHSLAESLGMPEGIIPHVLGGMMPGGKAPAPTPGGGGGGGSGGFDAGSPRGSPSAIARSGARGMGAANPMTTVRQTQNWTCGPSTAATIVNGALGTNITSDQAADMMVQMFGQSRGGDMPWSALPSFVDYVAAHADQYGGSAPSDFKTETITADTAIERMNQGQAIAFSQNTSTTAPGGVHGAGLGHIMAAQGMGNGQYRLLDPNKREGAEDIVLNEAQIRNQMNRTLQGQPSQIWGFSGGVGPGEAPSGATTGGTDARSQIIGEATQTYGARAGRVIAAILSQEGGLSGARGDNGQAFGPFQMEGGKLADFGQSVGISDLQQAGVYAEQHPTEAAHWAMTHYMSSALSQAGNLSDTDLMTTVLRGGTQGAGQNAGAATGSSAYYDRLREVQQSGEVPESYVNQPMMGQDLAASQQMMAMNVKFDNPTITIQLPDGTVLGAATLNPREDAVNAVDRSSTSYFGGSG